MARVSHQTPAPPSGVVELDGRRTIEHALGSELAELARFKTRKQLLGSEVYQRLSRVLDSLCFGIEYACTERPAAASERVRVVAWNIQRGTRLDGIAEALRSEAELARADVIVLLESDLGMARSGNRNVARELAARLGFDYVYGNSYLCLSAGNSREVVRQAEPNTLALSGNAILSRLPLTRAENFTVAITKDKFESSEKRLGHKKALWVEVAVGARRFAVAAVHLDSGASSAGRALQLADVVRQLEHRGLAKCSLIGGDFNTTTYDAQSLFGLLGSLGLKLWRGGFPHAIQHYLTPELLYERRVFQVLRDAGYDFASYNQLGVGTVFYRVGDPESEGRVRDFLPQPFVDLLRRKLEPYGGVVGLKLDWFAGKGLRVRGAGTVPLRRRDVGVSDHDPIWVDVEIA